MTTPNAHSSHAVLIAEIVELKAALAAEGWKSWETDAKAWKARAEAAEARLAEAQEATRAAREDSRTMCDSHMNGCHRAAYEAESRAAALEAELEQAKAERDTNRMEWSAAKGAAISYRLRAEKAESESAALRAELEKANTQWDMANQRAAKATELRQKAESDVAALAERLSEVSGVPLSSDLSQSENVDDQLESLASWLECYARRFKDKEDYPFIMDALEKQNAVLKQESERMREALRRILTLQVRVAGGLTSSAAIADAVLFAGEALSPAPKPQEQK